MTEYDRFEYDARMRSVIDRYGNEEVKPAQSYEYFEAQVGMGDDFIRLKPGFLARSVTDEIIQVMRLQLGKGMSCNFIWGVSLAWLPHIFEPRPRFHRTLKSARFDLFEWAERYPLQPDMSRHDCSVSLGHGVEYMELTCNTMLDFFKPHVEQFFNAIDSPNAVCDYLNAMYTGNDCRLDVHSPHPLLVLIFTEAKLGNIDNAYRAMDRYYGRKRGVPQVSRQVVESIIQTQ